ncbi:MAG: hypothetical protein J1F35_01275 [Erysipelotrichales bacterium]|nr:hypothetical protein [Erysipelotrichales bacterium]
MKDLSFLKSNIISYLGIYDNERIFENTLQSMMRANKFGYLIQIDVKILACGTIICFHDNNLKRLLHVDQELSTITYDELTYMANYQIPTLKSVLDGICGSVPLIINIDGKINKFFLEKKVMEDLVNYQGQFAIITDNKKRAKWFYKNYPEVICGYTINSFNYKKPYIIKKYDFLNVDLSLFTDKEIRKLKEDKMVIGYLIKTREQFNLKTDLCDNLIVDNILEIIE